MAAPTVAIESTVLDGTVSTAVTHQSTYIGIVVLHVTRHAAVINYAGVVLASDATYFSRVR